MAQTNNAMTVSLGDLQESVEARVKSGAYDSVSAVIQAALRALDREEAADTAWLREKVEESLSDPRPSIPAREVFARLRAHHEQMLERDADGV